jgi:hypothetical protein
MPKMDAKSYATSGNVDIPAAILKIQFTTHSIRAFCSLNNLEVEDGTLCGSTAHSLRSTQSVNNFNGGDCNNRWACLQCIYRGKR